MHCTGFLVIEKRKQWFCRGGDREECRVSAFRLEEPEAEESQIVVRLRIELPGNAFDNNIPSATLVVPPDCLAPPNVEIEAVPGSDT